LRFLTNKIRTFEHVFRDQKGTKQQAWLLGFENVDMHGYAWPFQKCSLAHCSNTVAMSHAETPETLPREPSVAVVCPLPRAVPLRVLQLACGRKLSLAPGRSTGTYNVSGDSDKTQDEVQSSKDREVTPDRRHGSSFVSRPVRRSGFDLPCRDETPKGSRRRSSGPDCCLVSIGTLVPPTDDESRDISYSATTSVADLDL